MPRNRRNARPSPEGRGLPISVSNVADHSLDPTLTSAVAVTLALQAVKDSDRPATEKTFTGAVVRLWGRPSSPRAANAFWRDNGGREADDPRHVPEQQFKRIFGPVIGWAILETRKPIVLGGAENEELRVFHPLRLDAGRLARQALVEACDGSDEVFEALSEPIPDGITQRHSRYSPLEDPQFRLAEYPSRGGSTKVIVGSANISVGYHTYEQPYQERRSYLDW